MKKYIDEKRLYRIKALSEQYFPKKTALIPISKQGAMQVVYNPVAFIEDQINQKGLDAFCKFYGLDPKETVIDIAHLKISDSFSDYFIKQLGGFIVGGKQ